LEVRALGRQMVVEYFNCAPELLNDTDFVRKIMLDAARVTGATIVAEVFHRFSPHGVSGVVVIAESHLAIHTWPEYGYAAVDLFTCGDEVDPHRGIAFLKDALTAARYEIKEFDRGLREQIGMPLRHKPEMEA